MFQYFLNKLSTTIPTFLGISLIAFAFIRVLPGDPIMLMAGERGVTPERYEELATQFGFDRPFYIQYKDFLFNILSGDFGQSFVTKQPVIEEFLPPWNCPCLRCFWPYCLDCRPALSRRSSGDRGLTTH